MSDSTSINIFKETLLPKGAYKGGKSKSEVAGLIGDKKLYKLSSNENYLGSSPMALDAIAQAIPELSQYPERKDNTMREALSAFYGGILKPDQFITDNSGVALLELIERAFLDPGLEIIINNPAFRPYEMYAKKLGAKVIDIPLVTDEFYLDLDGILGAITDKTRLLFLTSPNNPTGSYIPKEQMDALVNNVPDHVVIVYDEVYYQFADAEDFTTAMPYVLAGKNVIAVNSFSKAYGLAGMRIGYGYTTPKLAAYISQLRIPFMINKLADAAVKAALRDTDFINQTVSMVLEEKAFIYDALDEMRIMYYETQANFITIKPNMDAKELELAMLKEGIMVRPVANFGAHGCVRVTIGDREANEAYLAALGRVLGV